MMRRLWPLLVAAALAACGSAPQQSARAPLPGVEQPRRVDPDLPLLPPAKSGRGAYYQDDGPGENPPPGLKDVPDAEVRAEPYSKRSNRPYVVFGRSYTPITDDRPFSQTGVASWYGKKFHGQRTSSGELYDMYKMTAAHPTLPIPSYARITSLDSGKQVVVRINDRGPFHASRVVDVSYTAALKLGLLGRGSHKVEIERVFASGAPLLAARESTVVTRSVPLEIEALMLEDRMAQLRDESVAARERAAAPEAAPAAAAKGGFYLQLGAFSRAENAEAVRQRLASYGGVLGMLEVVAAGVVHRLFSGPFGSRSEAGDAARSLPEALSLKPIIVQR